jgi:hypothetical protein
MLVSGPVAAVIAGAFLGLPASAASVAPGQVRTAAASAGRLPVAASSASMARAGRGTATKARTVNVRSLAARPQIAPRGGVLAPLGPDGRPIGSDLPRRPTTGHRPMPAFHATTTHGPNTMATSRGNFSARPPGLVQHPSAGQVRPLTAPSTLNANFNGSVEANCGGCRPSDNNAAVGSTQIAESVNLQLRVTDKSGNLACTPLSLNSFLGTSDALSDPRVQYDNLNGRFSLSVTVVAASGSATPALWVAASQTGDACGGWFLFRVTFGGTGYPAGTTLDFPYLGQDRGALLISSNNFCCSNGAGSIGGFIGSFAFAIPKSAAYSGGGFSFTSSAVDFSTAPVTVAGIPMFATTTTYWLASVPGTGYDLYRMNTGGGPITLQARISSAFSAPTRLANQPGTNVTLDSFDGAIVWAPVQDGNFVWFAHGIDDGGFPTIRYGAINVTANTATVAVAFHSGTSDDFNPSIGVSDAGNGNNIWLNWAYTDTPNGVAASDNVDGVLPGQGVPNLIGTGLTLVSGFSSNQIDPNKGPTFGRFGDYSSVAVDPAAAGGSCTAGQTAVTAQQYFDSTGNWVTRLARLSFC